MKARIHMCIGMNYLISYNERKVMIDEAECLYAGNFLKDPATLTRDEKKARFADLIDLNPQTHRPATSLVVEFAPGQKLPKEDLIDIARDFMEGIDFGRQPYLVYQHKDTLHQHMHIISTKIDTNGDPIPESFIGVRRLQPTRRQLEEKYDLLTKTPANQPRHDPREKIQYGKKPTWQAVADTLKYILDTYRYRTLPELNAVLRLYNLTVKGGAPGTHLHEHRGLYYQILGDNGKPRNAPIKASELPFKPTLDNLEQRFTANRNLSATDINYTRLLLDKAINAKPADPAQFLDLLRKDKLAAVPTFNQNSEVTDFHFINFSTKTVLTPADLNEKYTAPAIRDRLGFETLLKTHLERKPTKEKSATKEKGPANESGLDL